MAGTPDSASRVAGDSRLSDLLTLDGYFPFSPSATPAIWAARKAELRRQLLVANGLWPMPEPRPAVAATVHGRVARDGYTIDRVFFEASPGLVVTGSLYSPAGLGTDHLVAALPFSRER